MEGVSRMVMFMIIRWFFFALILFGVYMEAGWITMSAFLAVAIWSESVRSVLRRFDAAMVSFGEFFRNKLWEQK